MVKTAASRMDRQKRNAVAGFCGLDRAHVGVDKRAASTRGGARTANLILVPKERHARGDGGHDQQESPGSLRKKLELGRRLVASRFRFRAADSFATIVAFSN